MHRYLHARFVGSALSILSIGPLVTTPALAQNRPGSAGSDECREIVLHNGKISTLDQRDTIATSVVIRDGRFAAVTTGRGIPRHSNCAPAIDLRGRRVIPGMVDNHSHIVSLGQRPGYDTRLETAFSIAE